MGFTTLMNDENYWAEVIIDKGPIEEEKEVLFNEPIDEEELLAIMAAAQYEEIHETESMIEEAMNIHAEKRYNRKYINQRKHKLEDKASIFFESIPSGYEKFKDIETKLSGISSIEGNCLFKGEAKEISTSHVLCDVFIIHEYKSWTGFLKKELIKGMGYFIDHKLPTHKTFVYLNKKDGWGDPLKKSFKIDNVTKYEIRELKHLEPVVKVKRVGIDYTYNIPMSNRIYTVFFYGKPVIISDKKETVFTKGHALLKMNGSKSYYRESKLKYRKLGKDLDRSIHDSIQDQKELEIELEAEFYALYDFEDFNEYYNSYYLKSLYEYN